MQANKWPTQKKDMQIAFRIIEEYLEYTDSESLGLFELVFSCHKEAANFRISGWVIALTEYFHNKYGAQQGDYVTRMIIGKCITNGNTVH